MLCFPKAQLLDSKQGSYLIPDPMETLEFESGPTTRVALIGLANARAKNINFNASPTGESTLDFSGQLQNDINVSINGNDPVALTIIIPKDTAVEVMVNQEVNNLVDHPYLDALADCFGIRLDADYVDLKQLAEET